MCIIDYFFGKVVSERSNSFLFNKNFVADGAMLAFCKSGFGTCGSNRRVNFFRVAFCGKFDAFKFVFAINVGEIFTAECAMEICDITGIHAIRIFFLHCFYEVDIGIFVNQHFFGCGAFCARMSSRACIRAIGWCCDFCFAPAVTRSVCGHRRSRKLCAANRAVYDFVIAARFGAGRRDFVFLDGIVGSVSRELGIIRRVRISALASVGSRAVLNAC